MKKVVYGYLVGSEVLFHHTDKVRAENEALNQNTTCKYVYALIDVNWFYGTWQFLKNCKGEVFESETDVWAAYEQQKEVA